MSATFAFSVTPVWAPYPPANGSHPGGGPWGGVVNRLAVAYDGNGNPATLWAATPGGIFKSADGGATWGESHNGLQNRNATSVAVSKSNPQRLLASVSAYSSTDPSSDEGGGVYISNDGGDSWQRFDPFLFYFDYSFTGGFVEVAIDPSDPNHFFAAANDCNTNSGYIDVIFESKDGGATWLNSGAPRLILADSFNTRGIRVTSDGTLYYFGKSRNIFMLSPSAPSPTALYPFPASYAFPLEEISFCYIEDISLTESPSLKIYAATGACGLWEGVYSGGSFSWAERQPNSAHPELLDPGLYPLSRLTPDPEHPELWFPPKLHEAEGDPAITAVSVDPFNPSHLFFMLYDPQNIIKSRIFESFDAGLSPSPAGITLPEREMNVRQILPDAGGSLMTEAFSGVYRRGLSGGYTHSSKGLRAVEVNGFDFMPGTIGSGDGLAEVAATGGPTSSSSGAGCGGVSIWNPSTGWKRASDSNYAPGRATRLITYEGQNNLWLSVEGFNIYAGARASQTAAISWAEFTDGIGSDSTMLNTVNHLAFSPDPSDSFYEDKAMVGGTSLIAGKSLVPVYNPSIFDFDLYEGWSFPAGLPISWRDWQNWMPLADPFSPGKFYTIAGSAKVDPYNQSNLGGYVGYAGYDFVPTLVETDYGTEIYDVFMPKMSQRSAFPGVQFLSATASVNTNGRLLAGTGQGLWETVDGGYNWSAVPLPGAGDYPEIRYVEFGPLPDDILMGAYVKGKGFYLTGDGGKNWSVFSDGFNFPDGFPDVRAMRFTPDGRALVASLGSVGLWSLFLGEPPSILVNGPTTVEAGGTLTLDLSASDPDGDAVTITSRILPDGPEITGPNPTWTAENTPPVLGSIGDRVVTVGDTLSFTVNAADYVPSATMLVTVSDGFFSAGNEIGLSATTGSVGATVSAESEILSGSRPNPASFNGSVFTWAPAYEDGGADYQVTFTATDLLGAADTETILVTVNRKPVLDVPSAMVFTAGQAKTIPISVSDPDGDSIFLSSSGLPSWLTLNPSAPSLGGTAPEADGGKTFNAAITATDQHGASIQSSFALEVNRSPVLSPIGDKFIGGNEAEVFSVYATDADGDSVTITVTGLPSGASFNGQTFSWAPAGSVYGTRDITFTATDEHGGTDSETITITIEETPNNAPVMGSIGPKFVNAGSLLTIQFFAVDPDGGPLTYSVAPVPPGASISGNLFTWVPSVANGGVNSLTFTVSDDRDGQDSETVEVTVNRPPTLTLPSAQNGLAGQTISFNVTASDPEADIVTLTPDGLPFGASFSLGAFSWTPEGGQGGNYNIKFIARDEHGASSEGTVAVAVSPSNRPPVLAPVGNKSSYYGQPGLRVCLDASDPDGDALDYQITTIARNGSAWSVTPPISGVTLDTSTNPPCFIFADSFAYNYIDPDHSPFFPQRFTVRLDVEESQTADHKSDSETIDITIYDAPQPNAAPVIAPVGPKTAFVGRELSFRVEASDADSDPVTVTASNMPGWGSFAGNEFTGTPLAADHGAVTPVTFTAGDGKGNQSQITVNVTVKAPPQFIGLADKVVSVGNNLSFTVATADLDGDAVTVTAEGLPAGANLNGSNFSWTPVSALIAPVRFTASDGVVSTAATVEILAHNPPVFAPLNDKIATVGTQLSFAVSVSDADYDIINLGVTGLPEGAVYSNGSFSWVPSSGDGGAAFDVTFSATDFYGATVYESLRITVNRPPAFTCLSLAVAHLGQPFDMTVEAADPDGDGLTVSAVSSLPGDMTFDPGTKKISWTPDLGDLAGSPYNLRFTASDGRGGSVEHSLILVLNSPPSFNGPASAVVNSGELLTLPLDVTDAEGDSFTITALSGLPDGMVFDGSQISWTPSASDAGSPLVLSFRAADDKGGVSTADITIEVNRLPVFGMPATAMGVAGEPFELPVTATDPDGDAVTVTASTVLPGSMSFDGSTLSWDPTAEDLDSMPLQVVFTANDGRGGVANRTLTLTLDQKPYFTCSDIVDALADTELAFGVTVEDPDGDTVTVAATSSLPEGMTFNGSVLRWTPSKDDKAGSPYTVSFRATDEYGVFVDQTLTINVTSVSTGGGGGGGGGGCFLETLGGFLWR